MEFTTSLVFQRARIRRLIIAAYWVIVILAVPIWWSLTNIERLSLPSARVDAQSGHQLKFPVDVIVKDMTNGMDIALLKRELTAQMENRSGESSDDSVSISLNFNNTVDTSRNAYQIIITSHDSPHVPTVQDRTLYIPQNTSGSVLDLTSLLLLPHVTGKHRTAKFSQRYRLAFTLLNEDAAAGRSPLSWDFYNSFSYHISPLLQRLSSLYNFTIESQVRFAAPLAFEPQVAETPGGTMYGLTPEQLTVFVNSAEWTLSSSVSEDPVLHFILFVPSAERRPLYIMNSQGLTASSNSFLLPQWGGIVIQNIEELASASSHLASTDLFGIFSVFRSQLSTLLGIPPLPPGVANGDKAAKAGVSEWQLDALLRRRTQENVEGSRDTLFSIVKLVKQIQNMPVGFEVRNDVRNALEALEQVYSAAEHSTVSALRLSSEALALASRAFFSPGMLALLYFPAEHTYAVYAPLFAPISLPLLAAVIREIKEWKRGRQAAIADNPN